MGIARVGYDPLGKPLRKYVSVKTSTEVVKKLKDLRRKIGDTLFVKDEDPKLADYFEQRESFGERATLSLHGCRQPGTAGYPRRKTSSSAISVLRSCSLIPLN